MTQEQKINQIFEYVVNISVNQEQIVQRLDSIDKRLSNIEVKMAKVEKFVALDNADFMIKKNHQPV